MLLSELGLTYETIYLDIKKGEHKTPGLAKYNPNGRLPVLIDHANNGFTIWCAAVAETVTLPLLIP